ncbi:MAG: formate/nitrite transporter family protein [Pseudomonadota bacterium]
MLKLFIRAATCNWMESIRVVATMISTSVPGKIMAVWMPILIFFYMGFEHSIVNMFVFSIGLLLGEDSTSGDYLM